VTPAPWPKVNWDKKQPVCDRCRASSLTYSYSESRRHGKHPWAKKVELGLSAGSARHEG
jgi:hypothetical protein